MHHSINILLLIFFLSTFTCKTTYSMSSNNTKDIVAFGIGSSIVTLVIGKALCTLYFDHFWPTHYLIDHSYESFKTISKTIEQHKNKYLYVSQLNDVMLKEEMYAQQTDAYPFMEYHAKIARSLFELHFYSDSLKKSVRRIRNRQHTINSSVYDKVMHQTLLELETQGKLLMHRIKRTAHMITTLQERVVLFHEYHNNCHNWNVEQVSNTNSI